MLIDCHVHLISAKGYVVKLVKEMDRLGIDRVCLLAGPRIKFWGSRMASNEEVLAAFRQYPDRLIPFGFVELGVDPPSLVDALHASGFRGLKLTRTIHPYNDDRLMGYYARAAALGLPILFHTGTLLRTDEDHLADVDSSRMKPILLDRIARKFPALNLIGAHLGNPWYEEAAMTLFWNGNVYFDLSGTVLKRKGPDWFHEVLWWNPEMMKRLAGSKTTHFTNPAAHPFERICFGSDVPIEEMERVLAEYRGILTGVNAPEVVQQRVMGGNLARMLRLEEV
jgi:predicted TIM-barrel fold metal-dependent hydrolase